MNGFGPVVNDLFTHVGKREFLLCVRATFDKKQNAYIIRGIALPPQAGDSVGVKVGSCAGYEGDIHNHPVGLGGLYQGAPHEPSPEDFASAKATNLKFFIVWYGPDQMEGYVR